MIPNQDVSAEDIIALLSGEISQQDIIDRRVGRRIQKIQGRVQTQLEAEYANVPTRKLLAVLRHARSVLWNNSTDCWSKQEALEAFGEFDIALVEIAKKPPDAPVDKIYARNADRYLDVIYVSFCQAQFYALKKLLATRPHVPKGVRASRQSRQELAKKNRGNGKSKNR